MAANGKLLLCQGPGAPIVIVDMGTGESLTVERKFRDARWSADGSGFWGFGRSRVTALRPDGEIIWDLETPFAAPADAAEAYGMILADPFDSVYKGEDWRFVGVDAKRAVISCLDSRSWIARPEDKERWEERAVRVLGWMGQDDMWVWSDDVGLWVGDINALGGGRRVRINGWDLRGPTSVSGNVVAGLVDGKIGAYEMSVGQGR
jgi:hypothetical protein